jgi:hypothetical protein
MMDKEAAHARGTSTGSTHDLSEKESVESVTDDVLLTLLTCHTEGPRRNGSPPHGELGQHVPKIDLGLDAGSGCDDDAKTDDDYAKTERIGWARTAGLSAGADHYGYPDELDRPRTARDRDETVATLRAELERREREIAQLTERLRSRPQRQEMPLSSWEAAGAHFVILCGNSASVTCRVCGANVAPEDFSAHVLTCELPLRDGHGAHGETGSVVDEATLVAQIKVTIPSAREVGQREAGGTYVLYTIKVDAAGVTWMVERRYREFLELHRRVLKAFPKIQLPQLRHKWWQATFTDVGQRQDDLSRYLNVLATLYPTRHFPPLRDFLQWDQHCT